MDFEEFAKDLQKRVRSWPLQRRDRYYSNNLPPMCKEDRDRIYDGDIVAIIAVVAAVIEARRIRQLRAK